MVEGGSMAELVRVPLEHGQYIVAEVDKLDIPGDDVVLAGAEPGKTLAEVQAKFGASLRTIRPAITELIETLKDSGPDSINVEFGIKIGGETGIILAKGTAEVNFKVSMAWKRSADEAIGDL
jgi:hypothetical protein